MVAYSNSTVKNAKDIYVLILAKENSQQEMGAGGDNIFFGWKSVILYRKGPDGRAEQTGNRSRGREEEPNL